MKKIYFLLVLAFTSVGFAQQYELVTNESSLVVGSKYIIAAQNTSTSGANANKVFVMSTTQNPNNRASVEIEGITTIPTTITYSNSYASFTLGSGTTTISHFTLFDPNHETTGGYLYAASSSNNYLKTQVENNTNGEFTIAINDNGVATMVAQGPNTRNILRFNGSNNPPLFSCYASGQMNIYLYKEITTQPVAPTATFNSESLTDFTYVENQATSPLQTITVTIADLPINETATLSLNSTNFTIVSPTELALENGEHTIELKLSEGLTVGEYTANLTVSHNETTLATLTLTGEVTEDETASTTENNIEGLRIFPNPANELVNITSNEVGTKNIAIYNMLGKKVLETSTEETVNVSTLTSGVYIMNITQDGKNASRKLVIK